jgi:hypothetical protein
MLPIIAMAGSFLVSKGLNLLGGVLSGGVKKGIDKVADAIEKKTGIKIEDISKGNISDEQLAKLKEFEFQENKMLLDHVLASEEARLLDVQNARAMQIVALNQSDTFSKRFIYYFASGIVTLAFAYMFSVTFYSVPEKNLNTVNVVTGFLLGTALSAIIGFFYGSSKSSSDKQEHINSLMKKLPKE